MADAEPLARAICETCAQELNLPHTGPAQPLANLWKLLQFHKQRATRAPAATPACPDCGMTLEELRRISGGETAPCLVVGGKAILESDDIVRTLADSLAPVS